MSDTAQDRTPAAIRHDRVTAVEEFVTAIAVPEGAALVATGSLARREMTEFSDVDVFLLLPDGTTVDTVATEATSRPGRTVKEPASSAHSSASDAEPVDEFSHAVSQVGYQLWDGPYRIDYSVRTTRDCVDIVATDITAALGLLDMRWVAGDEELVATARQKVLAAWRRRVAADFEGVLECATQRWARSGAVVTMTRPDIKNGRGGLRDDELGRALALAQVADYRIDPDVRELLLNVRVLLHEGLNRARDVVEPEIAVDIARRLGLETRYELAVALSQAAKTVESALSSALAQARSLLPRKTIFRTRRPISLDEGVVDAGGYVTVSALPDVTDPQACGFPLRVAAASARSGLPVARPVWKKLRKLPAPDPTIPWTPRMRDDFFALLSNPDLLESTVMAMDDAGLWARYLPAWDVIRGLMPREPSHEHTVDVHLLRTVALCAGPDVHPARPDLLTLAALLHDCGKGTTRPHAQVGAAIAAATGQAMGLDPSDVLIVQTLVAEHTLLMRLARTSSAHDPRAVAVLVDACRYNPLILELLSILTRADARATGAGVWTKSVELAVDQLVSNARRELSPPLPTRPFITVDQRRLLTVTRRDDGDTVHASAMTRAQLITLIAVLNQQGFRITRCVLNRNTSTSTTTSSDAPAVAVPEESVYDAVLEVRPTSGGVVDETHLIHAFHAHATPSPPALTTADCVVHWYTPSLAEIRTTDRAGVIATCLKILPDFRWIDATTPGSSVICRVQLAPGVATHQIEKTIVSTFTGHARYGR